MFKPMQPVVVYSLDTSECYEISPSSRCQRRSNIIKMEVNQIIRFLDKYRSTFTPYECQHLDSLIDKYESTGTVEAREELKTFLIFMRRCVRPSPMPQKSVKSSSDGTATTTCSDDTATTVREVKLPIPTQNGITTSSTSQSQLSANQHRFQHGFDSQIIPTILTDTPTGRPRHCRPLCDSRKAGIPCSCQQCLQAKRLTTKNSSSSSTDSVVQTTMKALKNVFGREKRKECRP